MQVQQSSSWSMPGVPTPWHASPTTLLLPLADDEGPGPQLGRLQRQLEDQAGFGRLAGPCQNHKSVIWLCQCDARPRALSWDQGGEERGRGRTVIRGHGSHATPPATPPCQASAWQASAWRDFSDQAFGVCDCRDDSCQAWCMSAMKPVVGEQRAPEPMDRIIVAIPGRRPWITLAMDPRPGASRAERYSPAQRLPTTQQLEICVIRVAIVHGNQDPFPHGGAARHTALSEFVSGPSPDRPARLGGWAGVRIFRYWIRKVVAVKEILYGRQWECWNLGRCAWFSWP